MNDDAPVTDSVNDICAPSSDVCPSISSERQVFGGDSRAEPVLGDNAEATTAEAGPCSDVDNTSPASSSPTPIHLSVPVHRVFVEEKKRLLTSAASTSRNSNYRMVTTCQTSRPVQVDRLEVGRPPPRRRRLPDRRLNDVGGPQDGASVCETEVERTKRRTARARERRATLVLGVVMISFVGCWLPFFFVYPVSLLTGLRGLD